MAKRSSPHASALHLPAAALRWLASYTRNHPFSSTAGAWHRLVEIDAPVIV